MKRFFENVFFLLGLAAVVVGLGEIYLPAALIGGGLLAAAAALVSRKGAVEP